MGTAPSPTGEGQVSGFRCQVPGAQIVKALQKELVLDFGPHKGQDLSSLEGRLVQVKFQLRGAKSVFRAVLEKMSAFGVRDRAVPEPLWLPVA